MLLVARSSATTIAPALIKNYAKIGSTAVLAGGLLVLSTELHGHGAAKDCWAARMSGAYVRFPPNPERTSEIDPSWTFGLSSQPRSLTA